MAVRIKEIAEKEMALHEKHTTGIESTVATNSWLIGIEAREHKLKRIESANEFVRYVHQQFLMYIREKKLPLNGAIPGVARKVVRLIALGYTTQAESIIQAVPAPYREFVERIAKDETAMNLYLKTRE